MAEKKKKTTKKKPTKSELRSSPNPFTGEAPNTFTQTPGVELPNPIAKTTKKPKVTKYWKERKDTEVALNTSRFNEVVDTPSIDPPLGARWIEPSNIPALRSGELKSSAGTTISPRLMGWLAGAHTSFPETHSGPAINEPHTPSSHEVIPRRLEDLSGNEIEHMNRIMSEHGYAGDTPQEKINNLGNIQMRNMFRVLSEHTMAGVNENSRQLFYGGQPSTRITDPVMHKMHEDKVLESQRRFNSGISGINSHPEFINKFGHLPSHEQDEIARTMEATALADTSPNNKWQTESTGRWPNMEQAEEVVSAHLEDREPKFISGRVQNNPKAVKNVGQIADEGPSAIRGMTRTFKTTPFRGALIDYNSPDSFTVTDIHEGKQIAPHLTTAKGLLYKRTDKEGNQIGNIINVHPDQEVPRGYKPHLDKDGKHRTGDSRVEELLSSSGGTVHAANDYVTRQINSELGISRGINFADNLNMGQAARWGSQQQSRSDVQVSHANLYPVIRDWASEGTSMKKPSWMSGNNGQWDQLFSDKQVTPAWSENQNTNYLENATLKPYLKN